MPPLTRIGLGPGARLGLGSTQLVLALGNYMNAGTFRGGAYGFHIDVLTKVGHRRPAACAAQGCTVAEPDGGLVGRRRVRWAVPVQLADTRSMESGMSLLHYVARSLEKRWPDHIGSRLKADMASLESARNANLQGLDIEIAELRRIVVGIENVRLTHRTAAARPPPPPGS